jgi:hypothetical protein
MRDRLFEVLAANRRRGPNSRSVKSLLLSVSMSVIFVGRRAVEIAQKASRADRRLRRVDAHEDPAGGPVDRNENSTPLEEVLSARNVP